MKIVLQRVKEASVKVEGEITGEIGKGYLLLLGVGKDDTIEEARKLLSKIKKLRIFADEEGKTNLSIDKVNGEVLLISQFTLYADCKKGNRPSFTDAASAQLAEELYEASIDICKELFGHVEVGVFGGDMAVSLVNDGPFTLVLDSNDL